MTMHLRLKNSVDTRIRTQYRLSLTQVEQDIATFERTLLHFHCNLAFGPTILENPLREHDCTNLVLRNDYSSPLLFSF